MFETVEKLFEHVEPRLVAMINNPDGYWSAIRTNTIPNAQLGEELTLGLRLGITLTSDSWCAALHLLVARVTGNIANPG